MDGVAIFALAPLVLVMAGCGSDSFEPEPALEDSGQPQGTEVLGFGTVTGQCEECLGAVLHADGACALTYNACVGSPECSKLLECVEACAFERDGADFNDCMINLCWHGSSEAAQQLLHTVYECACCRVTTCRVDCVDTCESVQGMAGAIYCP